MHRLTLLAVLVLSLVACSKSKSKPDDGPPCSQVVDNMLEVTKTQLTGHGDMELGNRKAMIAQCEQRMLSAEQRRCFVAAKDLTGIAACSKRDTPPAPPRTPTGSAAPAPTPAP